MQSGQQSDAADDLRTLTPRMFVERFGVPTDGQWVVLSDFLCCVAMCAIASSPVAGLGRVDCGWRPSALAIAGADELLL